MIEQSDIIILNYPKNFLEGSIRTILYPLWGYRITAPSTTNRRLNHFQKAVLGLLQCGVVNVGKIAELLGVAKELTAYVFEQLRGKGLISADGTLTKRGQDIYFELSEGDLNSEDFEVGYVFQDMWTHKLYPHFEQKLSSYEIDYEYSDQDRIVLDVGTVGTPKMVKPFILYPPNPVPKSIPKSLQILKAIKVFRQLEYNSLEGKPQFPETSGSSIEKISLIGSDPIQCYVQCLLHFPPIGNNWSITDPFRRGLNPQIKTRLESLVDHNDGLSNLIQSMELKMNDQQASRLNSNQTESKPLKEKLTDHFGDGLLKFGDIYEILFDLWHLHETWSEEENFKRSNARGLLSTTGVLMEALLSVVNQVQQTEIEELKPLLSEDKDMNVKILEAIAEKLHFNIPLPVLLTRVSGKSLINEYKYESGSIRPKAVISLLAANNENLHPFRVIGPKYPDLFKRIDSIAQSRNPMQHYSPGSKEESEVERSFRFSNEIAKLVLDSLQISPTDHSEKEQNNG